MTQHKLSATTADRDTARTLAGALQDLAAPPPDALTLFEAPSDGWRIEAYFSEKPDPAALRAGLEALLERPLPELVPEDIPDLNWVALSQAALPPVAAGRFTVHGSHDRGRVPRGPNAILIDAGEAFGTAHHATTHGCLEAIDRLTRKRTYRRVLDLGSGSGVLAIAVARAAPGARILATDIDRQSVRVAAENIRINGAEGRIRTAHADGLGAPAVRAAAPFDLVIANILAGPLIALSKDISRAMLPGGMLVLSGLLTPQAPQVTAAYAAAGFELRSHRRVTGWSTLTLRRRKGGRHRGKRKLTRPDRF
jgi:ribosomal protein L11 methyltransferase